MAGSRTGSRVRALFSGAGLLIVLALAVSGLVSCQNSKDGLVFVISLHELVQPGEEYDTQLVYPVSAAGGDRQLLVRRFPIVDSRFFYQAELMPDADGVHAGVRLYIDRVGLRIWEQISGYRSGELIAVLMDGFYVGSSPLPQGYDSTGVCTIKALWSLAEAEKVVAQVKTNYKKLSSAPESLH